MFEVVLLKTDVTALKIYKSFLIAGIGSQIQIFCLKSKQLKHKHSIFDGLRVHGINLSTNGTKLCLNAENEFVVFECDWNDLKFRLLNHHSCKDWILECKFYENDTFVTLSMHNNVELWSIKDKNIDLLKKSECDTKCIIYCGYIAINTKEEEDCVVLSGTVFSEVLIWKPFICGAVLHRLLGHEGVLFSIHLKDNHITTTSDDRSLILWAIEGNLNSDCKISLKHKMYGHTSRVFTSIITNSNILTGGEDGLINIWDFEGNLLRKLEAHQGGTVWKLEYDENYIISGGSDGAIIAFPKKYRMLDRKITLVRGEVPTKLGILYNFDTLVIMESGLLVLYENLSRTVKVIDKYEEFRSYALLEMSQCRRKCLLAGYKGDILILDCTNEPFVQLKHQIATKTRIYSVHWLTCKHILTSTTEGLLFLWTIDERRLNLLGVYVLPPCKERWTTAACILPKLGVAVGDRKGNIYIYKFLQKEPVQIVRKAHNYLGVTKLFLENTHLVSMGRNFTFKTYEVCSEEGKITDLTTEKLPFSWLCGKLDKENVLFGFSGSDMVLWDLETRKTLFNLNCGGGHRSWDLTVQRFVYLKDKCLHSVDIDLQSFKPWDLISGLNSSETNSLLTIVGPKDDLVCISGGEDTVLRVFRCQGGDTHDMKTFKSHLSSIRCLLLDPIEGKKFHLYSAGGRGQIIQWQFDFQELSFKQLQSFYRAENEEIRVMELKIIFPNCGKRLLIACSDGKIKSYSNLDTKINLSKEFTYKMKCILKLCIVNSEIFLSMATDGLLVFWRYNDNRPFFNYKAHQSGINAYSIRKLNNIYLILTGGDDNQFSLIAFKLNDEDIQIVCEHKNSSTHTAQITGVHLTDNFIFTSSLDQKLAIFKYDFNNLSIDIKFITHYNTTISDIKGINVIQTEELYYVVLYGLGIEVVKINAADLN